MILKVLMKQPNYCTQWHLLTLVTVSSHHEPCFKPPPCKPPPCNLTLLQTRGTIFSVISPSEQPFTPSMSAPTLAATEGCSEAILGARAARSPRGERGASHQLCIGTKTAWLPPGFHHLSLCHPVRKEDKLKCGKYQVQFLICRQFVFYS